MLLRKMASYEVLNNAEQKPKETFIRVKGNMVCTFAKGHKVAHLSHFLSSLIGCS